MSIDFSKPVSTDNYLAVLETLRDNIEAAITNDYTGGSNIPDRAIRYNESVTPSRWEKYNLSITTWEPIDQAFVAGTIMIFGAATAPIGWTRKSDWADNSMLIFGASGSLASGGTANPQDGHIHVGGGHTHGLNSHTHTGPSHTHAVGSLKFQIGEVSGSSLYFYNSTGTASKMYDSSSFFEGGGSGFFIAKNTSLITGGYFTNNGSGSVSSGGNSTTSGPTTTTQTTSGGGVNTGQNTTPKYQEVIAATKD